MKTESHKTGNLDENLPVKKANVLVESKYKLSSMEHKILGVLLAQIVQESPEDLVYDFPLKEFCEFIGIENDGRRYEKLKAILVKFRRRTFVIDEVDDKGKPKPIICGWVDSAELFTGPGRIELRVNRKSFPYLKKLGEGYTAVEVKAIVSMSGSFGPRLFELLKQYEGTKNPGGYWYREIMMDEFRKFFDLEKKYTRGFPDLRRKVLIPAVKDINENTRMQVDWEARKWGRAVGSIVFHCSMREDQPKTRALRSAKTETELKAMYDAYVAKCCKAFDDLEEREQREIKQKYADQTDKLKRLMPSLFTDPEKCKQYFDGLVREAFAEQEPYERWVKRQRS
jgi:plasmid replication initiation protein